MSLSRTRTAWIVASLFLLHALASFRFPWEEIGWRASWLRFSPDFFLLIGWGFVVSLRSRPGSLLEHSLTLLFLLVPLFRFGKTVMPVFYGKELDTYNDVLMAPSLVHLLLHRYEPWIQVVLSVLAIAAAVALYLVLHRLVRNALASAQNRRWCLSFLALGQLLVLLSFAEVSSGSRGPSRVWTEGMLAPASAGALDAIEKWREEGRYTEKLEAARERSERLPKNLRRLGRADVYVLFIESYGRSLFRTEDTARAFAPWAAEWQGELSQAGFGVASGYAFPSISGGLSSLAHAELLSGVEVRNRRAFDRLLASDLTPLPHFFTQAGYRALNVQPATSEDWPEGKFFGFSEDVFFHDFPYDGHVYHWGFMPDQFALAHFLAEQVRPDAPPLFVQYVSVTSHAPFSMIPPYYADWAVAANPASYRRDPERSYPIEWMNYAGHPDLQAAYMDTIRYSMETMIGFTLQLERPSLVLILGDHQPPNVGDLRKNDTSFDVPVHAVSNVEGLLLPFMAFGFGDGLVPPDDFPSFSSSLFLENFLTAFSEPD